ncbi:hypothetical protein E1293_07215 [Actinomadura darangshiensis]|uniref:Uncharacterized protein n=1 Tax=Actinomadura darangshiensis TaxID=705336 RepID=A0A4R5BRW1_9ACTN|nr:hypothetical protein E1293_07215 [Actinomadura darangshiensis]
MPRPPLQARHPPCGPGADGHWHGWYNIHVQSDALRRLGPHPDQPISRSSDAVAHHLRCPGVEIGVQGSKSMP